MSPILTRPVREQFEHDRIIRLLQARYRRKLEVAINIGAEQTTSVTVGDQTVFPDLVLYSQERGRKLQGTVEVETGESVNTLEAMSQWALFSRLRVPFALYVPPSALDTARRLCVEHNIPVAEIWTYHTALDQVRFTMVHRAAVPPAPKAKAAEPVDDKTPTAKTAAKTPSPKPPPSPKPTKQLTMVTKPAAKTAKATTKAKPAAKKSAKAASKTAAARKTARPAKRR